MKKIFVLLSTSLLVASMFIGCGGSSSGNGDSNKNKNISIPGNNNGVNPEATKGSSSKIMTGTATKDGCKVASLPGCPVK